MLTCVLVRYDTFTVVSYRNLSERVDSVGGQLRGEKTVDIQWRNQLWQSLEEDAGKRDLQCDVNGVRLEKVASVCLPRD